ncbi:hypothetical protein [Micromonospora chersina]|uniref:hypothetical protein n=1 Tax=Micromonospora chersina TaxID=47854 RepID=UPI0037218404
MITKTKTMTAPTLPTSSQLMSRISDMWQARWIGSAGLERGEDANRHRRAERGDDERDRSGEKGHPEIPEWPLTCVGTAGFEPTTP